MIRRTEDSVLLHIDAKERTIDAVRGLPTNVWVLGVELESLCYYIMGMIDCLCLLVNAI